MAKEEEKKEPKKESNMGRKQREFMKRRAEAAKKK